MIGSTTRRPWRRTVAAVAGTALVAAGLGMGAAPAHAADSVVSGNVTDALGNPVPGYAEAYQLQADGTYDYVAFADARLGHFELTVPDGTYKFEFTSYGNVSEWYLDKTDEASAAPVAVGGGAAALAAWTVEQPLITGTVVGADGRPVPGATVEAYDAATQAFESYVEADDKGSFVLPVGTAPVKVEVDGGRWASEWYNDKPTFAAADAVTGTPTGASIGVVTLSAGGAITGQVTNEAGAPLEMRAGQRRRHDVQVGLHRQERRLHDRGRSTRAPTSSRSPTRSASTSPSTTTTSPTPRPRPRSTSAWGRPCSAQRRARAASRRSRPGPSRPPVWSRTSSAHPSSAPS